MTNTPGPHLSAKDAAIHAFADHDRLKTIIDDLLAALEDSLTDAEGYLKTHGGGKAATKRIRTRCNAARVIIARAKGASQ